METRVVCYGSMELPQAAEHLDKLTRDNWRIIACVTLQECRSHGCAVVWTLVREAPSGENRRD